MCWYRKNCKSCHHQVLAHQQDRKEALGLEHAVIIISVLSGISALSLQFESSSKAWLSYKWSKNDSMAQSMGNVWGGGGEGKTKFHNEDSALLSVKSLHLASSFLFSTLKTHASCFICLTWHGLCATGSWTPCSLWQLFSADCKSKAAIFKPIPLMFVKKIKQRQKQTNLLPQGFLPS